MARKTLIQLKYDSEKLNALSFYLSQENKNIEDLLSEHIDEMFSQNVSSDIQNFIKFKSGEQEASEEQSDENTASARPTRGSRRQRVAEHNEEAEISDVPVLEQ